MKTMIATRPVSVIHHETEAYKPNRKGLFEIQDHHVQAMKTHGLVTEDDQATAQAAEKAAALAKAEADGLKSENDALKARIAELKAASKTKA
jgi:hypothetical protein